MTPSDADQFVAALDKLADALRVDRLDPVAQSTYYYTVREYSLDQVKRGLRWLLSNHKPYGQRDFPVPAELRDAIEATHDDTYTGQSRTLEEVKEDYRRRGFLIGEEARQALEKK